MKKIFAILLLAAVTTCFTACDDDDDKMVYDETEARAYLMKLFTDTNGAAWRTNTKWTSPQPISMWYGVSFDRGQLAVNLENNRLEGMVDFSKCLSLKGLEVGMNRIPALSVQGCPNLTKLDVERALGLEQLHVGECPMLMDLDCDGTDIKFLELRDNRALLTLECSACPNIKQLDMTPTTGVYEIECNDCPALEVIDLSKNKALKRLSALRCDNLKTILVWEGFKWSDYPEWKFSREPVFAVKK